MFVFSVPKEEQRASMKRAHQWRRIWLLAISSFALLRSRMETESRQKIDCFIVSMPKELPSTRHWRFLQVNSLHSVASNSLLFQLQTAIGRWSQPLSHHPASQLPFGPETAFSSAQKLHIQRKLAVCRHDARGRRAAMLGTWMLGCPMVWQVYLRMGGWILIFCCIL